MTAAMALEDLDWHDDARLAIIRLSLTEQVFTAEDLRRVIRSAPHANHVGLAFTSAKRAGLIEAVGYQISAAPSRKYGVLRTWRRKINEGVAL